MRVIELSRFNREAGGSFIPMVLAVCAEAQRRGHEAEAVFLEDDRGRGWNRDFAERGVPLDFAPLGSRRDRSGWLDAHLGAAGGDDLVLHTHFTSWDVPAALAARKRERTSAHWHVHSTLSPDPLTTARTAVKFATLGRSVDSYLCPAQNIADGVRRRGAPADRIRVVPSAVDTSAFPLLKRAEKEAARHTLGLPLDATVLIHFGWHWTIKGTDRFIEAVHLVSQERPVIGVTNRGGPKATELAAELGSPDAIRAIEGVQDIRSFFAAADLLVASSRAEGMPLAVLEALSSGVPVVATDIPGHAVVGSQVPACEVVGHDATEIAAGAARLLDRDAARAEREAAESRNWIEGHLGLTAYGEKMVDHFEGRDPFQAWP